MLPRKCIVACKGNRIDRSAAESGASRNFMSSNRIEDRGPLGRLSRSAFVILMVRDSPYG